MSSPTLEAVTEAIASTLEAAAGINEVQRGETISESIQNYPMIQVYWSAEETDASNDLQQSTFRGGLRQSDQEFIVDVYCAPCAHIGQDLKVQMTCHQAVAAILRAQNTKPYFNLAGIRSYHWRAERVTIEYSGVQYAGVRVTVSVRTY